MSIARETRTDSRTSRHGFAVRFYTDEGNFGAYAKITFGSSVVQYS
jgi:catalase